MIAELCHTSTTAKPCTTTPATGACVIGDKCTSSRCTKPDGTSEACRTNVLRSFNPFCPGNTLYSYSCAGCAPVGAGAALLLLLVASSGLVFFRRFTAFLG